MEIRVFNKALEPIGNVDEIATLIWKPAYYSVGTFSILAPVTPNNVAMLVKGNIITKHDGAADYTDANGNNWRRAAEIKYIHIDTDEKGEEQIEAQGVMLSNWLSKRCCKPQLVTTDTTQNIINLQVKRNCGSSAGTRRKFAQFDFIAQSTYDGSKIEYSNELLADLGTEVKDLAQNAKLGYDILVNERGKQYGFYLYKGRDLTSTNTTYKPCIFSKEYDNVSGQEYESSTENTKNFMYVVGKASDEETTEPVVSIDADSTSKGIYLEEVYYASDIARTYSDDNNQQQTIALATYKQMLASQGITQLSTYGETVGFESAINLHSSLQYKKDFDIGDRVTMLNKEWNIKIDARITQITETYQKGKHTLAATFGESLPTLLDKIRKVR